MLIGAANAPAQQQRNIGGFLGIHAARDLYLATRNFTADHGGGNYFPLVVFEQHNRHPAVNVVAGNIAKNTRALGVECQVYRGLLRLGITPGLCVLQVFAGQDHLPAQ